MSTPHFQVQQFDKAFPGITRREHWLTIYLTHREGGASHAEASQRVEFEMADTKAQQPGDRELELLRKIAVAAVRMPARIQWLLCGNRPNSSDSNEMGNDAERLLELLAELDALRNPSPAGRWTPKA